MPDIFKNYSVPYQVNPKFETRTAYFSMEFAIDQSLKIYSGGLGFLAGSHMRSAYDLKQNLIGIGILWKFGYYDQIRHADNSMNVLRQMKAYPFLEDTGIKFTVLVNDHNVWVKAYYLHPEQFGSAPIFLLSTDLHENDYLSQTITDNLYDSNAETKIAQGIILGIGGAKLIDMLNFMPNIYHLNEAHGLPVAFHLYSKYGHNVEEVRKRLVFTTHTPVDAGNDRTNIDRLLDMSYFQELTLAQVRAFSGINGEVFDHTLVALRMSKIANGVSKIHGKVATKMWGGYTNIAPITSITNSQNKKYWADEILLKAAADQDHNTLSQRKKELKRALFLEVADQTGKWFSEDKLTVVWARRFADYKRPDLIIREMEDFIKIFCQSQTPVQMIWAGKPYPTDVKAISIFNKLVLLSRQFDNVAVLTGYELALSKLLKQGSDIWLNNPRIPLEASGTSGMTAAMNASVNVSTWDGWIPEFVEQGYNGYTVPEIDYNSLSEGEQDETDRKNILQLFKNEIIPLYYNEPKKWNNLTINGIKSISPNFDSDRMAKEYYQLMYDFAYELSF